LGPIIDFLGLGADSLHDAGVLLSLGVLAGGAVALGFRLRAALTRRPKLPSVHPHRMIATLGVLGGFVAYLREISLSHGLQDLTLGGISAIPWVGIVLLEIARTPVGR